MNDEITDSAKIAAYMKSAKGLYDFNAGVNAIEIADSHKKTRDRCITLASRRSA